MKLSIMTLPLLPTPDIPGLERRGAETDSLSLSEVYAQIRQAGGTHLDISSIDFQFGGEPAVLNALRENGLQCACYLAFLAAPGVSDGENQRAIAAGKLAVAQTRRLGADVMMFVPAGYDVTTLPRREVAARFADVLRPVVEYAREHQVTVAIEDAPHREFPMCSEAELRFLLEAVPGLKLVYDSGNMLFAGENPVAYYDHLAAYTAHMHLKAVARAGDGSLTECRPGEGIVEFGTLFSHMKRNRYTGYMTIELAPDFQTAESIADRVRHAIQYFTGLYGKEPI